MDRYRKRRINTLKNILTDSKPVTKKRTNKKKVGVKKCQ